jgi:hypothetical protein
MQGLKRAFCGPGIGSGAKQTTNIIVRETAGTVQLKQRAEHGYTAAAVPNAVVVRS